MERADGVDEGLGARGAARGVDIDRDHLVDALHDGARAAARAQAHGQAVRLDGGSDGRDGRLAVDSLDGQIVHGSS